MKVGELKKIIANLPANAEVKFETDGVEIAITKAKTVATTQKDGKIFKSLIIIGEECNEH